MCNLTMRLTGNKSDFCTFFLLQFGKRNNSLLSPHSGFLNLFQSYQNKPLKSAIYDTTLICFEYTNPRLLIRCY